MMLIESTYRFAMQKKESPSIIFGGFAQEAKFAA